MLDTHTATAWKAGEKTRTERPQLVVATAHPVKFGDAVEKAIGIQPGLPDHLERIYELPERIVTIDPDPSALEDLIR